MNNTLSDLIDCRLIRRFGLLMILTVPVIAGAQEMVSPADSSPINAQPSKIEDDKKETKKLADNFKFVFEIGGQFVDVNGERPTKYEEFGRIREGLAVRRFRIASNPANAPSFFRAIGRSAGEIDQQYFVDFGSYGKFRTTFQYDGSPHLFSEGAKTLFTGENGILTIDDSIQTALQGTPVPALPAAVQSLYSSTSASTISLRTRRHTLSFDQKVQLTDSWSLRFNWTRNQRTGNAPLGIGSYERVGTPIGDTFRVFSLELPQPIDYVTDQVTLGTSYITRNWGISFDYIYSNFKNDNPTLTFDNPFRITDLQATTGSGNFDRQKFARGIISGAPGNTAQSVTVSAFVDLPHNTRAAAALGWTVGRQDEQFAPYTLNSAIVTGVPAGVNVTSTDSLPEQSLDAETDIFTQEYVIASRPWKSWAFNARFRRFDNEVKTEPILFPGYAAYGESYWRSNIAGVLIENDPKSFARSNVITEAAWEINKVFRLKLEYGWEGWERHHRQAERTNEHSFSTQLTIKPTAQFTSRVNYKYSDRTPEFYDPGVLEYSGLRMFDQSARKRQDLDWQWQWAIRPQIGLSGTAGYLDDDYDENFFGLVKYTQWYGTVDLMYMPKDNMTLYANYARENYKNSMQTIAKNAVPWDLNNRWNRDERDVLDNFGIGITAYAMKEKLFLDLNYVYSNAKTRTITANPGTPAANTVLSATAFPFPDVKSRLQEFDSDVSYQFGDRWGLGVRYKYQPYSLDDFAVNGLSPYPINALPAEQEGSRFLLLDSRYSSHKAHLLTVYLSIK
ncbi:MAG: MtrB/PioB family decaheme-associated outer membrane protein [bacterium]|nr:MtrB/PioB family decaheme-associated outer membrane protein [bacterium]